MKYTKANIQQFITDINELGTNLTPWEENFMESITEKFEQYGTLTDNQMNQLENIYARRTPS